MAALFFHPPAPPPATANIISNVPASVLSELLKKYGYITTSRDLGQNDVQAFAWQEDDGQFRQLAVTCTGFATNDGRVFVNRDVISFISTELRGKIERNERVIFDCSNESFSTVMTFVHTINSSRPTADFLLKLLPMLHDCKLPFLSDLCAYCICHSPIMITVGLTAAFRAENELLLEAMLNECGSSSQLRVVLEECNGFRDVRDTAFGGRAMGRIVDMMLSLPENAAPPPPPGVPVTHKPQLVAATTRFFTQFHEHILDPSRCLDFEINIGDESLFMSRAILTQSSRFFRQLFSGNFADAHLHSYIIENGTLNEAYSLIGLVLPAAHGMFWRFSAASVRPDSAELFSRSLLEYVYGWAFSEDPARFVNVFMMADYFQITGLVAYLTEVAVLCLPWRQRLQLADRLKSREIMASLLTDDGLKELKREMAASANALEEFSGPTKDLIIEFYVRATNP